MTNSILETIKQMLNIDINDNTFDLDIITQINSSMWRLHQLGVGKNIFKIEDSTATWTDFFGEDDGKMEAVKRYIYYDVRLAFDPPTNNASLYNAYKQELERYETLIIYECDPIAH